MLVLTGHALATPLPLQKPYQADSDTMGPFPDLSLQTPPEFHPEKVGSFKPLTNREADLYKDVFTTLENGKSADALIAKIDNPILMDFVTAAKNNTAPPRHKSKIQGTLADLRYFSKGSKYISEKYKGGQRYELRLVQKEVQRYLNRGAPTAALSYFNKHRVQSYIDPIDKSQILAGIAARYLYLSHFEKARKTALSAFKASDQAPLAGWVLGLTAWMNDDMVEATKYFTAAANAPYASPWMTAAASYWGARAATRAKLFREVSPLLAKAVRNQRTFYGLIATKALGYGYDFNWTMPDYTARHRDRLYSHPIGAQAVALIKIGDYQAAETMLFALPVKRDPKMAEAAIAFAHHYNLAGYAMRFSSVMENPAGGYYDAGLFPISSWTKQAEDMAMVNAFIRQESRFRPNAKNGTGATGLMQIMPRTAAYITGQDKFKNKSGQRHLIDPATNVQIGERYLKHLLELQVVKENLFGLAMAYNAGPGTLRRWQKNITVDDPLLFIELIPASETRAFVERVLTNYWIYQMQLRIEPKTLKAVAQGDWPRME